MIFSNESLRKKFRRREKKIIVIKLKGRKKHHQSYQYLMVCFAPKMIF
jgi:hypothetical protein